VMIPQLVCESVSIRGIARVLKIAVRTVVNGIRKIARGIVKPPIIMNQAAFEVDELYTYIGNKENHYWVAYAINRTTGEVIDFVIGKRTKHTLRMLINTLLLSGVRRICTDRLNIYRSLIPKGIHYSKAYCTNHIERKNLSIRTHIKRLSRRTICFSRSYTLLESCLRIYFGARRTIINDREK
jgi:IS1 family transposase